MASWIYYPSNSEFPLENLPYGVFTRLAADPWRPKGKGERPKKDLGTQRSIGVRIGDTILDLRRCALAGLLDGDRELAASECFLQPTLNAFMALDSNAWSRARALIKALLSASNETLQHKQKLRTHLLVDVSGVRMHLPCEIGDYSDFYASLDHAKNVGTMFRDAANALNPNWRYIPIGYHGRASSVVVSGTPVKRPNGQSLPTPDATVPTFGPCRQLDFELEVGCFFGGASNELGTPITMEDAHRHLFGMVLLNDWSARDIQKWEYVPLGPFCAKNFATTISPWVVTFEAMQPFLCGPEYPQEPAPFPYLRAPAGDMGNFDVALDVKLNGTKICNSNMKYLYWTFKQQLVHHTVTGCNMRAGDLLGSGTISGPDPSQFGSMLELAWKGTKPLKLADGTERKFVADGDTVVLGGRAQGPNYVIGFGECVGTVFPADTMKN